MSGAGSLALVLVSGGMDSCVTAALAARDHPRLAFLHAGYGQRTAARERQAFLDLAAHFHVERTIELDMRFLARVGGSSLTDTNVPVEVGRLGQPGIPSSYVPFRNANLLAQAVSWAEVLAAEAIYIGAVEEDSSGYPDCREVFYEAFNRVIALGTRPAMRARVVTPVIHKRKHEIVRLGAALHAPFHLTWSCYQHEDRACGVCDSCVLRLRGFAEAGVADPIPYATR